MQIRSIKMYENDKCFPLSAFNLTAKRTIKELIKTWVVMILCCAFTDDKICMSLVWHC